MTMQQTILKTVPVSHQEVWQILCKRQTELSAGKACKEFDEGLQKIKFDSVNIPCFKDINQRLKTGWKIVPCNGWLEIEDFFVHIAKREFPVTTWIRSFEKLDYLQEPDLFHDMFGHVPMLTNQKLCDFMEKFSKLMLDNIDNEEVVNKLARLWWFTVEFGLIKEQGKVKIFGGGIMSSKNEVHHSVSKAPKHITFDLKIVLNTNFHIDRLQDKFFVINSFDELFNCLEEFRVEVNK